MTLPTGVFELSCRFLSGQVAVPLVIEWQILTSEL